MGGQKNAGIMANKIFILSIFISRYLCGESKTKISYCKVSLHWSIL